MFSNTGATYRAAIIGCGGMGQYHAAALQATPGVALVALAELDPGRLETTGDRFGVAAGARYTDYREMLARERLHLVAIPTQAPAHCDATVAAAEAGVRGILCEKPMALDLVEADRMLAACARHGTRLAINHQSRLRPTVQQARRLIAGGAIGELVAIRSADKGGRPAGTALMEIATHTFDQARFYAGDARWVFAHLSVAGRDAGPADIVPSRVAAPHDRECGLVLGEQAWCHFGLQGNVHLQASFLGEPQGDRRRARVDVLGTDGVLTLMGDALYRRSVLWGPDRPSEQVPVGTGAAEAGAGAGAGRAGAGLDQTALSIQPMVQELLAAMEEGREHVSSGVDGRAALEMIQGVYESHRRRAAVDLPLADRVHPLRRWLAEREATIGRPGTALPT